LAAIFWGCLIGFLGVSLKSPNLYFLSKYLQKTQSDPQKPSQEKPPKKLSTQTNWHRDIQKKQPRDTNEFQSRLDNPIIITNILTVDGAKTN
jgi:hypothetical protein